MNDQGVDLIPRKTLFGNPERTAVTLSHDGTRVAYLAPVDGVLNVWVAPVEAIGDAKPVTRDRGRGIRHYLWSRVEERRGPAVGGGSSCCRRLSHRAGASVSTVATFPLPAHRTRRADFQHRALGRDHAFAHGKRAVRTARRVRPWSFQSRSSEKRTYFPARTLCLRHSHQRSRRIACASTAL